MRSIARGAVLVTSLVGLAATVTPVAAAQLPVAVLGECLASTQVQGTSLPLSNADELAYSASISCPLGSSMSLAATLWESAVEFGQPVNIASASRDTNGTTDDLSRSVQQPCSAGSTVWVFAEVLVTATSINGVTSSTSIETPNTPVICDGAA
jgi:hypothetical protein